MHFMKTTKPDDCSTLGVRVEKRNLLGKELAYILSFTVFKTDYSFMVKQKIRKSN